MMKRKLHLGNGIMRYKIDEKKLWNNCFRNIRGLI